MEEQGTGKTDESQKWSINTDGLETWPGSNSFWWWDWRAFHWGGGILSDLWIMDLCFSLVRFVGSTYSKSPFMIIMMAVNSTPWTQCLLWERREKTYSFSHAFCLFNHDNFYYLRSNQAWIKKMLYKIIFGNRKEKKQKKSDSHPRYTVITDSIFPVAKHSKGLISNTVFHSKLIGRQGGKQYS